MLKNKIKYSVALLCVLSLCVGIFATGSKSQARTASSGEKKICKEMKDLTGYYCYFKMKSGQKKEFDFSKTKSRRCAIKYSIHPGKSKSFMRRLSKRLFGKETKNLPKTIMGDWGGFDWPEIHNYVTSRSGKYYIVKADLVRVLYDGDTDVTTKKKMAKLVFKLKKSKKGIGGYVIKKLKIRLL